MRKTVPSLLLITCLITETFLAGPVYGNFFPPPTPTGIQITSDGSVVGTDKIKRHG